MSQVPVQSKALRGVPVGNLTGSFDAQPTAGNTVVVVAFANKGGGVVINFVEDDLGTLTRRAQINSGDNRLEIWVREDVSYASNPTFNTDLAASGSLIDMILIEVPGTLTGGTAFDVATTNTGTSGAPNTGATATLAQADNIFIAAFCDDTGLNDPITPSGMTLIAKDEDGTTTLAYSVDYKIVTSTAAVTGSWSLASGTPTWIAAGIILKAAGGGASAPVASQRFARQAVKRAASF